MADARALRRGRLAALPELPSRAPARTRGGLASALGFDLGGGTVPPGPCSGITGLSQLVEVYVDQQAGSDDAHGSSPGTAWKSLWKVRELLASSANVIVRVYLARGSVWSVASELQSFGDLSERVLDIAESSTSSSGPFGYVALTLDQEAAVRAYRRWVAEHPEVPDIRDVFLDIQHGGKKSSPVLVGASGSRALPLPVLDGLHGVWTDETTGVRIQDQCHVHLEDLEIRGFSGGVVVRGDSWFCEVRGCRIHRCFDDGILISSLKGDLPDPVNPYSGCPDPSEPDSSATASKLESWRFSVHGCASPTNREPRYVTVEGCEVFDNGIGSEGNNIAVSGCASHCTFTGNRIYSTGAWRGVDGITFDGSGTGHVVSCNWIAHHVPNSSDQDDQSEGSDGDGIDLKGVRPASLDDDTPTLIHDNVFLGNRGAGVLIHKGCKHIHLFDNVFMRNATAIHIRSGTVVRLSEEWWEQPPDDGTGALEVWRKEQGWEGVDDIDDCNPLYAQGHIYIYRNEISQSLSNAIYVNIDPFTRWHPADGVAQDGGESRPFPTLFHDLAILHNTIDYSGGSGVAVAGTAVSDVDVPVRARDVVILDNILSRNGLQRAEDPGANKAYIQVTVNNVPDGFGADTFSAGSDPLQQTGTATYDAADDDFATWTVDRNWYWSVQPVSVTLSHSNESIGDEAVWATNVYQFRSSGAEHVRSETRLTLPELGDDSPAFSTSGPYGLDVEIHWTDSTSGNPGDPLYLDDVIHAPDLRLQDNSPCVSQAAVSSGVVHALTGLDVCISFDADWWWPDLISSSSSGSWVQLPDLGAWQQELNRDTQEELACGRPPQDGEDASQRLEVLRDILAGLEPRRGDRLSALLEELEELLDGGVLTL